MTNDTTNKFQFRAPGKKDRAYAADDVDHYLDGLSSSWDELTTAKDAAVAEAEQLRQSLAEAHEEANARPVDNGIQESVKILSHAEEVASAHIAKAEEQATSIIAQAQEAADKIVSDKQEAHDAIEERIAHLQELEAQYKAKLAEVVRPVIQVLQNDN